MPFDYGHSHKLIDLAFWNQCNVMDPRENHCTFIQCLPNVMIRYGHLLERNLFGILRSCGPFSIFFFWFSIFLCFKFWQPIKRERGGRERRDHNVDYYFLITFNDYGFFAKKKTKRKQKQKVVWQSHFKKWIWSPDFIDQSQR